jgi:hypothetical protein
MAAETLYLNKARVLYNVIFYSFIFSTIGHALAKVLNLGALGNLFPFFPAVIGFIASPIGLFYIIKSYLQKEDNDKQKKIYLISIVLANIITLTVLVLLFILGPEIITF